MYLVALATVLAALIGLVRRWSTATTGEGLTRPFTAGTVGLLLAGAALSETGNHVDGGTGLVLFEIGLGLIAVGAAAAARIRAGFALIAVGVAANLAVVTADGGMPVRNLAPAAPAAQHHHGVSSQDAFVALADNIRLGDGYYSPGDLVVAGGAALAFLTAVPRRRSGPGGAVAHLNTTRP